MTGITGYLGTSVEQHVLPSMLRKLAHRGQAFEDFFVEGDVSIAICGSDQNQKPYIDQESGIAVFLDGHIYNAQQLKDALSQKGLEFSSDVPGELLARAYQAYGVQAFKRLRGAFAVAIYDLRRNLVVLARDHMGIKPMFYTTTPSGAFVFGSEVKALLEYPGVHVTPDMMMIDAYLTHGFCPNPQTLFKGIHALPQGHCLTWNPGLHIMLESFWEWDGARAIEPPSADAQATFNHLFDEAVRLRIEGQEPSDVGVVLSPDIASVALALSVRKHAGKSVKSYSAQIKGDDASQQYTSLLSEKMGFAEHHAATIQPSDLASLPELTWALDQPVGDPLVLSRHHVARDASHSVNLLMSAETSDDVMGGHILHQKLLEAYRRPKFYYGIMRHFARHAPLKSIDGVYKAFSSLGSGTIGEASRHRLIDFIQMMHKGDPAQQYLALASIFNHREKHRLYSVNFQPFMETYVDLRRNNGIYASFLNSLQGMERRQGVSENIGSGFDRIAGLSGVTLGLPFADAALADFMRNLPDDLKLSKGQVRIFLKNYITREGKGRITPPEASQHIKPFPFAAFTSSPTLRELMGACLSDESVQRRGLFDQGAVKRLAAQAKDGDMLSCRQVFSLISLEMWFRIFVDHEKGWIS